MIMNLGGNFNTDNLCCVIKLWSISDANKYVEFRRLNIHETYVLLSFIQ